MLSLLMAARPSTSLPAVAVLLGAVAAGLLVLVRPGAVPIGVGWLALAPVAALAFAGPARAAAIAGALAYAGILHWAYTTHFSPVYAYAGLIDADPAPASLLIVAALTALPAAWLPLSARRPSTIVLWALYVVGYVPTAMVPLYLEGRLGAVLPFDLALVGSMALLSLIVRLRPPAVPAPHLSLSAFTGLLIVLGLLCLLYIAATFGVHAPPGLSEVYTTRAQFAVVQSGAAAGGYIVPWAANAVNPMLMALGIARRRAELFALGLAGQLLIYSDTGYKAVLFSITLVPVVYLVLARAGRWFGSLAVLLTPLVLAGAVIASGRPGDAPLALATRLFATPGHVSWYYYDYFSTHPQYQLSHSILSGITNSPYSVDAPLLIGSVYFHQGTDANGSMWADAFANFGFGGIAAFSAICAIVLLTLDGLGRRRDPRVAGPTLAIAGLSLGSTALFTTVLTQGLALAGLLIALMPPDRIPSRSGGRAT
jgi:hypothetical protein